jgi:hypothetical protein
MMGLDVVRALSREPDAALAVLDASNTRSAGCRLRHDRSARRARYG